MVSWPACDLARPAVTWRKLQVCECPFDRPANIIKQNSHSLDHNCTQSPLATPSKLAIVAASCLRIRDTPGAAGPGNQHMTADYAQAAPWLAARSTAACSRCASRLTTAADLALAAALQAVARLQRAALYLLEADGAHRSPPPGAGRSCRAGEPSACSALHSLQRLSHQQLPERLSARVPQAIACGRRERCARACGRRMCRWMPRAAAGPPWPAPAATAMT